MNPSFRSQLTTEELIAGCVKKEKYAWDAFVERYSKVVLWAARRRLRRFGYYFDEKDIEDIHQDVFISIWEKNKLSQVKNIEKVASWITIVAGNAAIDYFKKVKRQSPPNALSIHAEIYQDGGDLSSSLEETLPAETALPDKQVHLNEISEALEVALVSFEAKEKMAIKLNLLCGMKHHEIADAMGIPLNTVSTTIARTKTELRNILKRRGFEDF